MSDSSSPPEASRFKSILSFLKKYWYLVILCLVLGAALFYLGELHNVRPQVLLRDYGYYVILVWTFLEGETIVIIAGMFSGRLGLNPWIIALCAFIGSFLSDQIMFSLGKYKGESVLQRFPRLSANVDKAAALFKKYDIALILGFRFVYGVRNVTPILLGISGVSHRKFFFLNLIGAGVWALTFTFGGLYSGKTFMHLMTKLGHGVFYVLLASIIVIAGWFYLRKRKTKQVTVDKVTQPVPVLLANELDDESKETPPDIT